MKLVVERPVRRGEAVNAFTLAETVISMLILGLVCAGAYGGISVSFHNVQVTREDLRATQIILQRMETIRLYTWSQSDPSTNFVPTSFTAPFDNSGSGPVYQVNVTITNAPGIAEVYSNDLRMITVQASWMDNNIRRSLMMSTYIAKAGLLWYVPN